MNAMAATREVPGDVGTGDHLAVLHDGRVLHYHFLAPCVPGRRGLVVVSCEREGDESPISGPYPSPDAELDRETMRAATSLAGNQLLVDEIELVLVAVSRAGLRDHRWLGAWQDTLRGLVDEATGTNRLGLYCWHPPRDAKLAEAARELGIPLLLGPGAIPLDMAWSDQADGVLLWDVLIDIGWSLDLPEDREWLEIVRDSLKRLRPEAIRAVSPVFSREHLRRARIELEATHYFGHPG